MTTQLRSKDSLQILKMDLILLIQIFFTLMIQVTAQMDRCPELFLRYSQEHTYCKPDNLQCKIMISFVSPDDIATILKVHNNLRSKIATGKEGKLPPASDMLQMVWDDELAAVAQKHANQCVFEHDCADCRRVQNFKVGQNLAQKYLLNGKSSLKQDWADAIGSWYEEISFFNRKYINPFIFSKQYGHFSQVVWAKSWRVGCGYVSFKEGNTYYGLYTCNYGPTGNIVKESMYKEGQTCSACPENSCCDVTCGVNFEYPGLCKITDNRAPLYAPKELYIFRCNFEGEPDCNFQTTGKNDWKIYNTLSGNYLGIVLRGGEESDLTFSKSIIPSTSSFCFVFYYRKGSNVAGQEDSGKATQTFVIVGPNQEIIQSLPDTIGDDKQSFFQYKITLSWNMETKYKLSFSVPAGKPEQFIEVKNFYVKDGLCT